MKRTGVLVTKVSEEEREEIVEKAKQEQRSVSNLLRWLALEHSRREKSDATVAQ